MILSSDGELVKICRATPEFRGELRRHYTNWATRRVAGRPIFGHPPHHEITATSNLYSVPATLLPGTQLTLDSGMFLIELILIFLELTAMRMIAFVSVLLVASQPAVGQQACPGLSGVAKSNCLNAEIARQQRANDEIARQNRIRDQRIGTANSIDGRLRQGAGAAGGALGSAAGAVYGGNLGRAAGAAVGSQAGQGAYDAGKSVGQGLSCQGTGQSGTANSTPQRCR
jgi:hypothetical protein